MYIYIRLGAPRTRRATCSRMSDSSVCARKLLVSEALSYMYANSQGDVFAQHVGLDMYQQQLLAALQMGAALQMPKSEPGTGTAHCHDELEGEGAAEAGSNASSAEQQVVSFFLYLFLIFLCMDMDKDIFLFMHNIIYVRMYIILRVRATEASSAEQRAAAGAL